MILDPLFGLIVPLVVFGVIASKLLLARNEQEPFYPGRAGEQRRDEINERYQTTRGAIKVGIGVAAVYGLVVWSLFAEWGNEFFTYVISALLVIPFLAVYSVVVLMYMTSVHAWARRKIK